MKPFDWDSFTTALESLGCKVEYECEKTGFYSGEKFLYSIEDIFPELFHKVEEFDVFETDDLHSWDVVKYSYCDDYQQIVKVESDYLLGYNQCSDVMINDYRLKEAA